MTGKEIRTKILRVLKFGTKNLIRPIFILVSLSFIVGFAGWLFVIRYINANNIGEQIAKQIERSLGRSVLISRVKFVLPTTFILEDFKIIDSVAPDYKEFVAIKKVKLDFDIAPLLENKVIVKEAIFENPTINIVKTPKGNFNLPEIKTHKRHKGRGTEFDFTTQGGTAWQVIIEDWVLKNGTFAYRDLLSEQSHSLNGLNLRFYNLEFNEDTAFDLNFILRNKIKDKVVEGEVVSQGKINFADFKLQEMSLKNTDINLYTLKKPIQIYLNLDNFLEPKVDVNISLPQVEEGDVSFLFDTKEKYSVPATTIDLKGEAKESFSQINVSSLSLKNKDIKFTANGNLSINPDGITAAATVQNIKLDTSKIAQYFKPLKPYALVGNLEGKWDFTYNKSGLKTKKLTAKSSSLSSKILGFIVEKANLTFDATENFNKMSAVIQDGIFKVGRQTFSSIKGRTSLDYKKQDFYAIAESALANGKPMRMSVGIKDVRQIAKRDVKMLLSVSELDPLEIFNIVEDFAAVLSDPKNPDEPKDTSDLAWLRNFRAALPKFMINFSGSIYAEKLTSPVLAGKDFYGTFTLNNLLPQMEKLNGKMDARLSEGVIYKLQEAADNQKVLGVAYQPFVIMSRMERAGSFKMGQILKDTPFEIMGASVNFKNGDMTVNNYYVDGSVISAAISGHVDWVRENFDLNIMTMFKNTSKRGALAENLTDESGDPAFSFVTYGSMSKPKLEMKSPKKVGRQIQEARKKDTEQFEEIKKFKE